MNRTVLSFTGHRSKTVGMRAFKRLNDNESFKCLRS